MKANSGRSLWKPYESVCGREMRILAANPGLPKSRLSKKMLQNLDESDNYPLPGHRVLDRQRRHKPEHKNIWPLFDPSNTSEIKSFCPGCSELGYHSWLFEMSWLQRCPIHGISLDKCSTRKYITGKIGNFHEIESNLYKTKSDLVDALFDPLPYFKALDPLLNFCQTDFSLTPINLFNPKEGAYALDYHNSHYAGDLIFPSLMVKVFPKCWRLIENVDPPLQKYVKIEIDKSSVPDFKNFYFTGVDISCHFIRERIRKRILSMIRARSNTKITEVQIEKTPVLDYLYDRMDILTVAYKIWLSIIRQAGDTSARLKNICGDRIYYNIFGVHSPLPPVPMLGFTKGKRFPNNFPTYIDKNNVIPLSLTFLVYEVDCWCLFRAILKFLSIADLELNATSNGMMLATDLIDRLPLWTHPRSHYSSDLAVYIRNGRFLTLIPSAYLDPDCTDIRLDDAQNFLDV
jgi:hypothetical protein